MHRAPSRARRYHGAARLKHEFDISPREGYIWVVQRGRLDCIPSARGLHEQVEAALRKTRCRRAVFDNRLTQAPPPNVRDVMFDWASGASFERVALLLESELVAVRASMEALSLGRRLKAFDDAQAAVRWLMR